MFRNILRMEILFRKKVAISLMLVLVVSSSTLGEDEQRWSRQLTADKNTPAIDSGDWVPLSEPCPTCEKGAALESGSGPVKSGRAVRFAQHDSAPAAQSHFQFVSDTFNNRFNFHHTHPSQPGFRNQPVASDINAFAPQPPTQNVNELQNVPPFQFLPQSVAGSPNQAPLFVDQGRNDARRPVMQHLVQPKPTFPQFIQNDIPKPQMLHHLQPQQAPQTQFLQPQQLPPQFPTQSHRLSPFQNQQPLRTVQNFPPQLPQQTQSQFQQPQPQFQQPQQPQVQPQAQPQQPQSDEEVQLLYVPYNTLYPNQQQPPSNQGIPQFRDNRFNILNQPLSASAINDFYSSNTIPDIPTTRRPETRRTTVSVKLTTTTPRPTTPFFFSQSIPESPSTSKPKPHQPPLSMFLLNDKYNKALSEKDVLLTLKNSNSIDVRDTLTEESPNIFIGPSGMPAPQGYTKFELPYLSNIENTRNERRVEQLPFFVAPLSYRTPPGFSKIPLPAPHVGSVVINQPENSIEEKEPNVITKDYYTKQPLGATIRIERPKENTGEKDIHRLTLSSGLAYRPPQPGRVEEIPLSPTSPATPASEFPTREYTAQKISYTPQNHDFFSTALPTTTKPPRTEYFPSSTTRYQPSTTTTRYQPSTTRQPKITRPPTSRPQIAFNDFEEDVKHSDENQFNGRKTISSFKFGTIYDKPSHDFSFKPMPDLTFPSDSFEPTFTEEPTTKRIKPSKYSTPPTTEPPRASQYLEETFSASPKYTFPSSTESPETSYEPQFLSTFEYQNSFDNFKNRFNLNEVSKVETQTDPIPDIIYSQPQEENIVNKEEVEVTTTEKTDYQLPSELPPINAQIPGLVNSLIEDKWMEKNNIPELETTTPEITTRRPIHRGRRPISSAYRSTTESANEEVTTRRPVTRGRRPPQYSTRSPVYNSEGTSTTQRPSTRSRTNIVRNPNRVRYNATGDERNQVRSRTRLSGSAKLAAKEEDNLDYQRDVLNQNYPSVRPAQSTTNRVIETDSNENYPSFNEEQYEFKSVNIPSAENVEVIPLSGNVTFVEQPINDYETYYTPSQSPLYHQETETEIITTTTTTTPSTTTPSTTDEPPTETNKHYSHNFLGLQEPMLIPQPQHKTQRHRERTYENFYNQNSQTDTEIDNHYSSPKFTTDDDYSYNTATTPLPSRSTTTTETNDLPVTRRGSFPRRRPTTYTTNPEASITTTETPATVETFTSRSKGRKENVVVVKKVRQRTRKPVTTTEETVEIGNQQKSRVETSRRVVNSPIRSRPVYTSRNRETTTTTEKPAEESRPRFRIRENTGRFKLDQQESQWSTRLTQNSFQPFDEEKSKSLKNEFSLDDDQEIVTAGPVENDPMDTYLFNVSASVTPAKKVEEPADAFDSDDTTVNMISTTESEIVVGKKQKNEEYEEPSFVKLMKDALTEIVGNDEDKPKAEQYQAKNEKKPIGEKKSGRRGVWKKVRVRPADAFETAESQNIGQPHHYYNSLAENTDERKGTKNYSFEFQETPEEEKNNEKVTINEDTILDPTVETSTETIIDAESTVQPQESTTVASFKEDVPAIGIEEIFSKLEEYPTDNPDSESAESEETESEKKSELIKVAKQALTDLFHLASEEDVDDETSNDQSQDFESELSTSTTTSIPEATTTLVPEVEKKDEEHSETEQKKVMGSQIVGTSTSTEISHETEICYRGRCIKTDKNKKN